MNRRRRNVTREIPRQPQQAGKALLKVRGNESNRIAEGRPDRLIVNGIRRKRVDAKILAEAFIELAHDQASRERQLEERLRGLV